MELKIGECIVVKKGKVIGAYIEEEDLENYDDESEEEEEAAIDLPQSLKVVCLAARGQFNEKGYYKGNSFH